MEKEEEGVEEGVGEMWEPGEDEENKDDGDEDDVGDGVDDE